MYYTIQPIGLLGVLYKLGGKATQKRPHDCIWPQFKRLQRRYKQQNNQLPDLRGLAVLKYKCISFNGLGKLLSFQSIDQTY